MPVAAKELDQPRETKPQQGEPEGEAEGQFQLESIGGQTRTVLPGDHLCIDESSMKSACVEVGNPLYPGSGSLFLDVTVELKNLGSEPRSITAGELVANLDGRRLRYALVDRSAMHSANLPPLGKGIINAQYEVPVDVLNHASFAVDLGAEEPVGVEFETPSLQEQRKEAARSEAAVIEEERRVIERDQEAVYNKCWSLNDRDAAVVSRQEFSWFAENCAHMYDVGDYEAYLSSRRH